MQQLSICGIMVAMDRRVSACDSVELHAIATLPACHAQGKAQKMAPTTMAEYMKKVRFCGMPCKVQALAYVLAAIYALLIMTFIWYIDAQDDFCIVYAERTACGGARQSR